MNGAQFILAQTPFDKCTSVSINFILIIPHFSRSLFSLLNFPRCCLVRMNVAVCAFGQSHNMDKQYNTIDHPIVLHVKIHRNRRMIYSGCTFKQNANAINRTRFWIASNFSKITNILHNNSNNGIYLSLR